MSTSTEKDRSLNREKVRTGTRFCIDHKYGLIEYYFGFERGHDLIVRRKGGHYVGDVTCIADTWFEVSVWILDKVATVTIYYKDVLYVQPKND